MARWHKTEFDYLPLGAFAARPGGGMALHGGGDTITAAPPDPALVEAQMNSMNMQTEIAGQMAGMAQELMPYQIQQMQQGIRASDTAYNDSRDDRAYSLERRGELTGLQNTMIGEANSYNSPAMQESMAAKGIADAETMLSNGEAAAARNLTRQGVNPASGAALSQSNASSIAKAGIKVAAANSGREQARSEGRMLTDRASNALSGYPAMSMNTTQNSVANGMAGLTAANQASSGIQSGLGAGAAVYGSAASTAGSLYSQQANYQLGAVNANNSADNGMWSAAGSIAGAGLMAFSDNRLKVGIQRVADDPRGFGWYEYRYLGGTTKHLGVMAQEVARIIPKAVVRVGAWLAVDYSMI